MEATKQRRKKLNRKQFLTIVIMLCVMLLMLISFAWYYFKVDKEADSEQADVMAPYYLYLLDEDGNSLSLSIGSLHPGETKQVVIGVSNKPAGSTSVADYLVGKDSKFDYKMALAYTQNLPITYTVYELEEAGEESSEYIVTTPSGEEVALKSKSLTKDNEESEKLTKANNLEMYSSEVAESASVEEVVNYVQYDLFLEDHEGKTLCLATTVANGITSYEMDYYLIEMEWEKDVEFSNFILSFRIDSIEIFSSFFSAISTSEYSSALPCTLEPNI